MILQVEEVTKAFGGLMAVDHVSLNIEKGEISSIIGPNGAGKSTLFNLITNHTSADSGKVVFKGENITQLAPERIQRKGLLKFLSGSSIISFVELDICLEGHGGTEALLFLDEVTQIPRQL